MNTVRNSHTDISTKGKLLFMGLFYLLFFIVGGIISYFVALLVLIFPVLFLRKPEQRLHLLNKILYTSSEIVTSIINSYNFLVEYPTRKNLSNSNNHSLESVNDDVRKIHKIVESENFSKKDVQNTENETPVNVAVIKQETPKVNDREPVNLSVPETNLDEALDVIHKIDNDIEISVISHKKKKLISDPLPESYFEDIQNTVSEYQEEQTRKSKSETQQQFNGHLLNIKEKIDEKIVAINIKNANNPKNKKQSKKSSKSNNNNSDEDWDIWNDKVQDPYNWDKINKIEFFCDECSDQTQTIGSNELTKYTSESGSVPILKLNLRHKIVNIFHMVTIRIDAKSFVVVAKPKIDVFEIPNSNIKETPKEVLS